MEKYNCLLISLMNDYGSSFGVEYFFFPEASWEEIEKALGENPEYDHGNIRRNFRFFDDEERKEIMYTVSSDLWDQTWYRDGSLKHAIKAYWK